VKTLLSKSPTEKRFVTGELSDLTAFLGQIAWPLPKEVGYETFLHAWSQNALLQPQLDSSTAPGNDRHRKPSRIAPSARTKQG
jgi:hypothetical protein